MAEVAQAKTADAVEALKGAAGAVMEHAGELTEEAFAPENVTSPFGRTVGEQAASAAGTQEWARLCCHFPGGHGTRLPSLPLQPLAYPSTRAPPVQASPALPPALAPARPGRL